MPLAAVRLASSWRRPPAAAQAPRGGPRRRDGAGRRPVRERAHSSRCIAAVRSHAPRGTPERRAACSASRRRERASGWGERERGRSESEREGERREREGEE
eukprot:scaffold35546_cov33-Tisochrysis_lutea.AAC.1